MMEFFFKKIASCNFANKGIHCRVCLVNYEKFFRLLFGECFCFGRPYPSSNNVTKYVQILPFIDKRQKRASFFKEVCSFLPALITFDMESRVIIYPS